VMTREYSGTLTSAENQAQHQIPRNPKVKLSTSTKMKKVRKPKSPKPSSGLMTWKNFLGTLETPRKRRIGETRPEAQNTLKT